MLTASQYVNAMADFGASSTSPTGFESGSISAAAATASNAVVESIEAKALAASQALLANASWKTANVPCDLKMSACKTSVIESLGRKAFRRQMAADEVADYSAAFDSITADFQDPWRGLAFTIAALMQSPNFVFRVELDNANGQLDADGIASRLAFFLTNGPPDEMLKAAAASGQLSDPQERENQAVRLMMASTQAKGSRRFFEDWWQLDKVPNIAKDATIFPNFSAKVALSMREQALRAADRLITNAVDVRTMFDEEGAEVDAELAKVYGTTVEPSAGWVKLGPAFTTRRRGILGWPAMLALHSKPEKTSLTERGVFLLKDLMCGSIPTPPDVFPPLPKPVPNETTRQLVERHRSMEPCKSCHALFDPIGIVLEPFDSVGAYRTKDNGGDIDPSGEFVDPSGLADNIPVADVVELARRMREHPQTGECFVRKLNAYALGRPFSSADAPWVTTLQSEWAGQGFEFRKLLLAYVKSPQFIQSGSPQ
jgi:Protein of unknown function (DUF1592)/Protein of unknown function (DUF1588)/Protein of unknown function (DUF1595)/Protein of unknown function (DUF1585)